MIPGLQPYPQYKESGSRWLGPVPSHWEVRNLRTLIRPRTERNRADLPLLSVAREKGVFVRSLTDDTENHNVIPEDLSNYKVARVGSLVINKMKAWQGSMGIAPCDGIVSPAYFVFDFAIANHSFGQILLRSKPYVAHFGQASDGVRVGQWDLTIPGMRQIPLLVPLPEEQAAIVRFLDYANGRLERAIRAKRKIIAFLNEQKQAIIHRAVTRGLESTVPLKPSGVSWLGDIPKHWSVVPLKFLCHRIQNGATPSTSEQRYYENGTVPWFGPSSVGTVSELGAPVRYLTKAAFTDGKAKSIHGPAILVIVIGATAGKMGLLVGDGATNQQITAFELKVDKIVPPFAIQQLRRSENWLKSTASTATIPILDSGVVNRLPVAFPPCDEQQAILSAVSLQTQPLIIAISRFEREIELLREYRTRLVADVVTGKIDILAAASELPSDAVPPETVPDAEELLESEDFAA